MLKPINPEFVEAVKSKVKDMTTAGEKITRESLLESLDVDLIYLPVLTALFNSDLCPEIEMVRKAGIRFKSNAPKAFQKKRAARESSAPQSSGSAPQSSSSIDISKRIPKPGSAAAMAIKNEEEIIDEDEYFLAFR